MSRIEPAPLPDDLPVKNNLVRATYNNPDLHRGFASLSGRVHSASHLPARTRELVVLRVSKQLDATYELLNHEAAARHAGITDAELAALRAGDLSGFDPPTAAAIEFGAAVDRCAVDDAAWAAAREHYSPLELSDLAMLAAFYGLACRYTLAMDVDLEPGA